MTQTDASQQHRGTLRSIAQRAMAERGLFPAFSAEVLTELQSLEAAAASGGDAGDGSARILDSRHLLWVSIDNDESRDLDQLTVAETLPGAHVRIRVAVADVDALVKDGSAIDRHARHNAASVYTAAQVFPMLPETLSTDLTSLNPGVDRLAVVVEFVVDAGGTLKTSDIYRARVRNHAKLAYRSVAAWLEGTGPVPGALEGTTGLADNLRVQDGVARSLESRRHVYGALSLETVHARPVFEGDQMRSLEFETKNRATAIIENFMIAANGVTARYLDAKAFPSIRRVVRTPKRWGRIVDLARQRGTQLPDNADSVALDAFLVREKAADPGRFADLSLSIVKLLGAGEYLAEPPGVSPGHFGLAVRDYTHSTAPNRRYPDLVTQRLLKAAMAGQPAPYSYAELDVLARHLTRQEDAANKVERQVGKSAAALLLSPRIGEHFDALVTGASDKGTWARLLTIPVEGRVVRGVAGLDVGDHVRVALSATNVQRGFIDFECLASATVSAVRQ